MNMNHQISHRELFNWCSIPLKKLENHPDLRISFRIVKDSAKMGELMASDFITEIKQKNKTGEFIRAIVPCGPKSWYEPFCRKVNKEKISLKNLFVFHMDECLDWQGELLPKGHPYNFRAFMEKHFYGGVSPEFAVPADQRFFPTPHNIPEINQAIAEKPVDITLGGWGQDGHLAYNQTRRHPFSSISLEELKNSTTRVQDNNFDTIITLGQRSFGAAYQFVPPMSVTLGIKQCMSAKKIRVYSDTGTWKQTALRVVLFSPPTVEYPFTLLQEHPDVIITATEDTARHPISENPDWDFFGESGYYDIRQKI
jgi:glucosamine-6-phosphate deaminase